MQCESIPFIKAESGERLNLAHVSKIRVNRYWNGSYYVEGLMHGLWYNLKAGFKDEFEAEKWVQNTVQ